MKNNILIICQWGRNRSKYLASYLTDRGFKTKCAGLASQTEKRITQELIDWSKTIIFVMPEIKRAFLKNFKIKNQTVIALDVEDRAELLFPKKKKLIGKEWIKFQEKHVYPELIKQIGKYLK